MSEIERQVIINTTNIAMIMKLFWIILGSVGINVVATFFGITKNGKKK